MENVGLKTLSSNDNKSFILISIKMIAVTLIREIVVI